MFTIFRQSSFFHFKTDCHHLFCLDCRWLYVAIVQMPLTYTCNSNAYQHLHCMLIKFLLVCRSVLSMLSRVPLERPSLDELLDTWGPIAQTVGGGVTNESHLLWQSS
jgi:hypothetical protein